MNLFLDKKSTNIFKSFVPNNLIGVIYWLIGVFGTISTIIFVWTIVSGNDFSVEKINSMGNGVVFWIIKLVALYWIPTLVIVFLLAYIHHLLSLLLPFLPEPDNYDLEFAGQKNDVRNPKELNLVVLNRKNRKFINCRIKLISLVHIDEDGKETDKIKEIGSNYLAWENGDIERTIDETTSDVNSSAIVALASSEWGHNIVDFYKNGNKKRLSDKGIYKYRVVVSGKNFRPIPHEGYFEFIHEVRPIHKDTFSDIPENKDIEWGREYVIPLEGNPEDYRRFCKFGFVKRQAEVVFKP